MSGSGTVLRTPEERLWFCDAYFHAVGARCTYEAEDYREYELPRDVDKELTDRPYYWMWVEQTRQDVPPTVLRCAFSEDAQARENERLRREAWIQLEASNPSEIERMFFRPPTAELITLGSFRLDKIFSSLDHRGRFACARESGTTDAEQIIPWLVLNAVISYRCDMLEQEWVSIGVCLVTGQTMPRFMRMLDQRPMVPTPATDLLRDARLSPAEALKRARETVETLAQRRPTDWAREARQRLTEETRQIRLYYDSLLREADPEEVPILQAERQRKLQETERATSPRIEMETVQLALVGLAP